MDRAQIYISAFFTICIYTLVLYKDNKLFRFSETVMVAITAANAIVLTFHNYIKPAISVDIGTDKKIWLLIPIALGLLMYARFLKGVAWLARIPMGFFIGVGAGYVFTKQPALFLSQIQASFIGLTSVNNILFVIGIVTVITYFFFTVPLENKFMQGTTSIGKVFLLIAFGAGFANTVMTRISVLLGRLQFMLQDVLKLG